mmetsp:Transcript_2755/g.5822  ORF Transcript_2755/g.5822 Transcript_2755/m.5822 type:complete len:238 (+) Transcript_2755:1495-2208(+)
MKTILSGSVHSPKSMTPYGVLMIILSNTRRKSVSRTTLMILLLLPSRKRKHVTTIQQNGSQILLQSQIDQVQTHTRGRENRRRFAMKSLCPALLERGAPISPIQSCSEKKKCLSTTSANIVLCEQTRISPVRCSMLLPHQTRDLSKGRWLVHRRALQKGRQQSHSCPRQTPLSRRVNIKSTLKCQKVTSCIQSKRSITAYLFLPQHSRTAQESHFLPLVMQTKCLMATITRSENKRQ